MDHHDELVLLISNGTQLAGVIQYFMSQHEYTYTEAHDIIRHAGIEFIVPKIIHSDGISEERRKELQELSVKD